MDGWARDDEWSAGAASWARAERAVVATRVLLKILGSDRDKEQMMPMKDLGCFDCGWLMLTMELWVMAAQWVR